MTQEQEPKKKKRGPTIKQKAWLESYLTCWNATEAARVAKYENPRHSGYENSTKPYIREEIHKRLAATAMGADEALHRLGEQGRSDVSNFFTLDEDGKIILCWDKIKSDGHLIKSITFTRSGPKIEVYDKQAALVHIGKHHGLFGDSDKPGVEVVVNIQCHEGNIQHQSTADALKASGDIL